jgi:predicted amidophosphoribosyltransferase
VVTGFLNENPEWNFDYIIPSPTFVGDGGRTWDHTALIVQMAAEADDDDRWPFYSGEPALITKTAPTTRFVGRNLNEREEIAETEIRVALLVPDPALVQGKELLVVDDVFTDGLNLNEVARALRAAGAAGVYGLTLARQPWGGGP